MSRGSSSIRWKVMHGKPGVAGMVSAAGHCSRGTQGGLRKQPLAMLRFV